MAYYSTTIVNAFNKIVGFGVYDDKGREIGARYCVQTLDVAAGALTQYRSGAIYVNEAQADHVRAWMPGARVFLLGVSATRGGNDFGAAQEARYFKTEEERSNALEKYLQAARKRAHKTAGVEMLVS